MVFNDQIYHQTKIITKKAKTFLSKTILNITSTMHKIRCLSLFPAVESAVNDGSLPITGLGRNIDIDNKAKEAGEHR